MKSLMVVGIAAFAVALLGQISAVAADLGSTYYWGPSTSAAFETASKWRMEDGTTATKFPGWWVVNSGTDYPNAPWSAWQAAGYKGDTAVFTNAEATTVSGYVRNYALNYFFRGTNVTLTTTGLWGPHHGGTLTVDGPAKIKTDASFNFADSAAPEEGGTFTFDVKDPDGSVSLANSSGKYVGLGANNTFVKTGEGKVTFNHEFRWNGTVDFREGVFKLSPDTVKVLTGACLRVTGPAPKTLYAMEKGNLILKSYEESEDASGKLTIYREGEDAKWVVMECAEDVPRFTAHVEKDPNHGGSNVQLHWKPTVPGKTLDIVETVYHYYGFTIAAQTNGIVRFSRGAGATDLLRLRAYKDGTIAIAEDAGSFSLNGWEKCLDLIAGAFLKIEGRSNVVALKTKVLDYDGEVIPDGIYRAGDFPWLIGEGWIRVGDWPTAVSATWTGNGGADTSVLNPANWGAADNRDLPDLTSGSLVATFSAGTKATIPAGTAIRLRGIDVSAAPQGWFVFEKGGADAEWALGPGGVVAGNTAFTNACPLFVMASSTWSVSNEVKMTETAVVRGSKNATITIAGGGAFDVSSSNPDFCNLKTDGHVRPRADWALGGPLSTVTQDNGGSTETRPFVYLYGHSFSNRFESAIQCKDHIKNAFLYAYSGTNNLYGKVTVTGSKFALMSGRERSGAVVNFHGGLDYAKTGANAMTGGPRIYDPTFAFYDVPFNVTKYFYGYAGHPGTLELNVASNVTTRGIIMDGSNGGEGFTSGKFRTKVPYALYATDDGQSGFGFIGGGTWDLCGCDQGVNVFWGGLNHTNCSAVVTSADPATLHLRDDRLNTVYNGTDGTDDIDITTRKVQVDRTRYRGAVSLSKEGVLDRWMMNASTTAGDLSVSAGRMIFASGNEGEQTLPDDGVSGSAYTFKPMIGSWAGKTVNLSGTGVLELHHDKALPKDVALTVSGEETARLAIPAGVTLKCKTLTVNGRPVEGIISSGLVTGGGLLRAGRIGLSIIVQ